MKSYRLRTVTVARYKSGPKEGETRPFVLPDGAQVVAVRHAVEFVFIDYVILAALGSGNEAGSEQA